MVTVVLSHPVYGEITLSINDSPPPGGNYILLNGHGAHRVIGENGQFFKDSLESVNINDPNVMLTLSLGTSIKSRT